MSSEQVDKTVFRPRQWALAGRSWEEIDLRHYQHLYQDMLEWLSDRDPELYAEWAASLEQEVQDES